MVGIANARPNDQTTCWFFSEKDEYAPPQVSDDFFEFIRPPAGIQNHSESRYFYQNIHQRAVAVIEINPWDMERRNGIFFFQKRVPGQTTKLLRHILIGCSLAQTSMITRPGEMWMLTEENVLYFGPNDNQKMITLTDAGRMDPALWFAGAGRVRAAMGYLHGIGIHDINAHAITGNMTLLHMATLHNRRTAVRNLLRAKADPEARDDQQLTCVMIASSVEYPDVIRILCEEGSADPNARTHCEETALHIVGSESVTNQYMTKTTVLALLDSHADPNAEDIKGQTPLFSFAVLSAPSTVKLLCSRGADPMHRNLRGRTPLHTLFDMGLQSETATVLVKRFKADVDTQDSDGVTPLMLAAHSHCFTNVSLLLLKLNANPFLRNNRGRDALWYARDNSVDALAQQAMVRLIETQCAERSQPHSDGRP